MYNHPDIMRAVYQARSQDLHRRLKAGTRRHRRLPLRITARRNQLRFRPDGRPIRPATANTL